MLMMSLLDDVTMFVSLFFFFPTTYCSLAASPDALDHFSNQDISSGWVNIIFFLHIFNNCVCVCVLERVVMYNICQMSRMQVQGKGIYEYTHR